jgi:hypothetical protein
VDIVSLPHLHSDTRASTGQQQQHLLLLFSLKDVKEENERFSSLLKSYEGAG